MKVQLLFSPDCPHVVEARARLSAACSLIHPPATIEEVDVTAPGCPPALQGWGSPTILVNGSDVEAQPKPAGASCRLYRSHEGLSGIPSLDMIARALRQGGKT